jgi:hypothetical protein
MAYIYGTIMLLQVIQIIHAYMVNDPVQGLNAVALFAVTMSAWGWYRLSQSYQTLSKDAIDLIQKILDAMWNHVKDDEGDKSPYQP